MADRKKKDTLSRKAKRLRREYLQLEDEHISHPSTSFVYDLTAPIGDEPDSAEKCHLQTSDAGEDLDTFVMASSPETPRAAKRVLDSDIAVRAHSIPLGDASLHSDVFETGDDHAPIQTQSEGDSDVVSFPEDSDKFEAITFPNVPDKNVGVLENFKSTTDVAVSPEYLEEDNLTTGSPETLGETNGDTLHIEKDQVIDIVFPTEQCDDYREELNHDADLEDMPWVFWGLDDTEESLELASFDPSLCDEYIVDDSVEEEPSNKNQEPSNFLESDQRKVTPLYDGATINVWESVTSILSFIQSENISGAGVGRLLSLIALHLPESNAFFKSSHELFKLLEDHNEPVSVHYFCRLCLKNRESSSDLCDVCKSEERSVHYYISFPIKCQIQRMYQRPTFVEDIKYRFKRDKQNTDNIEDVYDGELYKEAASNILAGDKNISLTWNTDGMQIFESTSYSLWPFYLVVNELPPNKRYLSENVILAGVWGSISKPHPNIYLQPIYQELVDLRNGVDVQVYDSEGLQKIHAILLCGTCDSPARALFMNMKTHSGFFSCPQCKCKGVKVDNTTVFPYEENSPRRTMEEYKQQVQYAVDQKVIFNTERTNDPDCCGIKGPTLLSYLVGDLFRSISIDSMHALYLGVMRQMMHLWFDKENKDKPFSIHVKINEVNQRLQNLSPPHFVQRRPQSIDKLVYWKASELRTFLFFFSLCVLFGILPELYFNHFMLFVQGTSLLNFHSVSHQDIVTASLLLNSFVEQFEGLYGLSNMSHNVHVVIHLPMCVKTLGPLWATSCFPFEDLNGRLAKLIHGTRHAGMQIHSNLSMISKLPLMVQGLNDGPAKKYCEYLRNKWMRLKISDRISNHVYSVGIIKELTTESHWVMDRLLENELLAQSHNTTVQIFHRLLKHGFLFVSASYGRGKQTSSFVKYQKDDTLQYGCIEFFVRVQYCPCITQCPCPKDYMTFIRVLQISSAFEINNLPIRHIFQYNNTVDLGLDIVKVDALQHVMYHVDIGGDRNYLSEPLNKFEME